MNAQHEDDWVLDTTPSSRDPRLEAAVRTAARTRKSRVQVIERREPFPCGVVVALGIAALFLAGALYGAEEDWLPCADEPGMVTQ